MIETREIDLAWGAVNYLGIWARQALDAIEQSGGRNPHLECSMEAGNLIELRKYGYASIAGIIAKATGTAPQVAGGGTPESKSLSLRSLIQAFKQNSNGRYQKLTYKTRLNYDRQFHQIDREVGGLSLETVTPVEVLSWYERWSANGKHLYMGHTVIGKVRMLFRYGAATLQDRNCIRLNGALSAMRIKSGTSKVRQITAKQADTVRIAAHKMNLSPIALAQALIFDLKLGQKQVIGEWIPLSEPGVSEIIRKKRKWIPGLQWSQIDSDLNLRLRVGDEITEINLKRGHGMIMAELNRLDEIPRDGPMIIYEKKRKRFPYTPEQFRAKWRIVATAAGVPKSIRNVHYQIREPSTAGNVITTNKTNPDEGGAPIDNSKVWEFISALCSTLSDNVREEVAAEMARDVLDGKVNSDQLPGMIGKYVNWYHQTYENKYGPRSLDESLPSGRKLGDTIQSDHGIWK